MFELGFHNPNQVIFKADSSLDFPTNKKKPRTQAHPQVQKKGLECELGLFKSS
jgi:hypothetical protein